MKKTREKWASWKAEPWREISIEIRRLHEPAKRPRTARGRMYDPGARDKKLIRAEVESMLPQGWTPFRGPCLLSVVYYMPEPSSFPALARELAASGELVHASRPDLSNYVKQLEDALNGVLWEDDGQIVRLEVSKAYASSSPWKGEGVSAKVSWKSEPQPWPPRPAGTDKKTEEKE